jgi:hypothetical protein
MDAIGLKASDSSVCKRIYGHANSYWIFKDAILTGTGVQKSVTKACRELLKLFEEVGNSNNFFLIMAAERIMCIADMQHFLLSQTDNPAAFHRIIVMRTLQEGVDQMGEVNAKLAIRSRNVKTFHAYSSHTRTIKGEHDKEGLPKDAIRRLLPSHKTRLENKTKGMDGVSNEELSLIGLRHANIRKAEQLYTAMQREALGVANKPKKQRN